MSAAALDTDRGELELRDYLAVLRRRRGIIVLAVLLSVGVALAFSFVQKPVYSATAEVLLQPRTSESILSPSQQQQDIQSSQDQVQTEIQVMRSRSVVDAVAKQLGYTPHVSIAAKGPTDVVTISSQDSDPAKAANDATNYASTYVDVRRTSLVRDLLAAASQVRLQINGIDKAIAGLDRPVGVLDDQIASSNDAAERQSLTDRRAQLVKDNTAQRTSLETRRGATAEQLDKLQLSANVTRTGGAQIVSEARKPTSPVAPTPERNAVIALFLGLLLGGGLAFLVEYLDDSLRTKDDLDRATGGLSVLGLVPAVNTWRDRREPTLVSIDAPHSSASEAYRALRTSLQFIGVEQTMHLVQMTSPSASEGKTTTIANLAIALARAGQRVVLVDCDLRRPRLHQFMGLSNEVGFTSVILGEATMEQALVAVPDQPRIVLLPSGPPPPNPSEVLSSKTARDLIRSLAGAADYVLIDTPPLLPVADAIVVAGFVDAVILVATARSTTKRAAHRAVELLRQVDAPVIGAVLNGVGDDATYAYGYGGYGNLEPSKQSPRYRWPRRSGRVGANETSPAAKPPSERDPVGDSS